MKRNFFISAICTLVVITFSFFISGFKIINNNNEVSLPSEWKFKTGDASDFSKPEFNDSEWSNITVGSPWESKGYDNYNGIAWYRTKVIIPSYLKNEESIISALQLLLGQIDDDNQTFINGKLIGSTQGYDKQRVYFLPYHLIKWDKENTIAVRVDDSGGNGGMISGPYSIGGKLHLSDIVSISDNNQIPYASADKTEFSKKIIFDFKVPVKSLAGTISVRVFNPATQKVVFTDQQNITIGIDADSSYQVKVKIKEPGTYFIDGWFSNKIISDTLKFGTLYTYIPIPRIHEKQPQPSVKLMIPEKTNPIELENIKLGGYLEERLKANLVERLLKIDETGILECYYRRPGKQTWVGEYVGKYLHAASRAWKYSKNPELRTQMDRIIDVLIACQKEDGYLGTYLPQNYWTHWDVWAHKYNMLGLLSYYSATGYKPALEASKKMANLMCRTFGEGKRQQNIVESSGHMGMASTSILEPMTELYRFTGDKKYLDFCNYIIKAYDSKNGPKIISTLTTVGKVDKTANAKAYEMLSNLTGIVKLYQLTGNKKLLAAADIAWNDIAKKKLYITGTTSEHEYFRGDFFLPADNDAHIGEGCVTTTWLQFCQALYNLTGHAKYITEIEKSIYNHLLAAENPKTGCVSYYTALQGTKPYRCTIDAHCCLASIPRGIAAIPELAFTKKVETGFNINLYTPGQFTSKIKANGGKKAVAVKCSLKTVFPASGQIDIKISPETTTAFRVALIVPLWCNDFIAEVNGKLLKGTPGTYLNIDKTWSKNSIIKVSFKPKQKVIVGGISYPNSIAFKLGPQVLAVDQALNPHIKNLDELTFDNKALITTSVKTLLPKDWFGSQVFNVKAIYNGKPADVVLVPFADAGQTGGEVRVWVKK